MEEQEFKKEKSEYGVQYLLFQIPEENKGGKMYQKDIFLQPFYSKWNGNLKLNYLTKGMQHIEQYVTEQEDTEKSKVFSELWHILEDMETQEQKYVDLEEIYVSEGGNVRLIYLPGIGVSDEIDWKKWRERLEESSISEAMEERTVSRNEQEGKEGCLTLRSTNSTNCFVIGQDVTVLGKSEERADMVIRGSASVSRRHCRIIKKQNQYYAEDLGSLNHTYKNGVLIEPGELVELNRGDSLRLSDIEFTVEG